MTYSSVTSIIENAEKSTEDGKFLLAEGKLNGLDNVMEQIAFRRTGNVSDELLSELQ